MGYVVRMPQLGMSMEEGTVVEWTVDEGDEIEEEEPIAVVESEKTTSEVEARESGVLRRILVGEGRTVEPGDPIGIVAGPDEDLAEYEAGIDVPDVGDDAVDPGATASTSATETGATTGSSASDTSDAAADADVRATPGARKLAAEEGVDLAGVEGTGPQGVVTEDDVESHVEAADEEAAAKAETAGASRTVVESEPLSGMQRTISDRLGESYRNAVHVTLDRRFDAGTLSAAVEAGRQAGVEVSIADLLVKTTGVALSEHPAFNAVFEDGEHRLIEEVNVGVAVDVERGLVTPVVPEVTEKSTEEVHEARTTLTERVRSGEFTMDDLSGGTFTISNLGHFGVDSFDPIIDPPQIAILGVGRVDDEGSMTLSLSFDHRVVNGADAAQFLGTIVDAATDPATLSAFFDADVTAADIDAAAGAEDGTTAGAGAGRTEETREVRVESASGLSGTYETAGVDGAVGFDEPTEMGGAGTAPTPVEHLLGALGSCLSLSVRAMADRDDVAVGRIDCDVDGSPTGGPLESVAVELAIESDASDDALDRVVTKAERACYVERALSDDLDVSVSWRRG